MTEPRSSRRRRRSPRTPPALVWLGRVLALGTALGLLWIGGVSHGARAMLHGVAAVGFGLALALPGRTLERAGLVRHLLVAALPLGALLVGLCPLPRAVLAVLVPGRVDTLAEGVGWATASLVPERTVDELSVWLIALAYAGLGLVWVSGRKRRESVERGVLVLATLLAVTPFVHTLGGLDSVYGVFRPSGPDPLSLAPFVNANQLGSTLLVVTPALLLGARLRLARDPQDGIGWWSLAALGLALGAAVQTRSPAVLGILAVQGVWALVWTPEHGMGWRWWLALAAVAPMALGLGWLVADPLWWDGAVGIRLQVWRTTLNMVAAHWGLGVGGGAFVSAYPPFQSISERVVHAHSDPLEWVAETGVLGAVALTVALALWSRVRARAEPWAAGLSAGVVSLLVHSLVDFPLQMPGILVAGALAWAVSRANADREVSALVVRVMLGLGLAAAVLGGLWEARGAVAAAAEEAIYNPRPEVGEGDTAARRLSRVAPWRAAPHVHRAWMAEMSGDRYLAAAEARKAAEAAPWDGTVLRIAALTLARAGQVEDALALLDVAARRSPRDIHVHLLTARLQRVQGDQLAEVEALSRAFVAARETDLEDLVRDAWKRLPLCVVWLDALREAPATGSALLGQLCHADGDDEGALLAFEQAALLQPWRYRYYPQRAVVLYDLGREGEGLAFAREATLRHHNAGHAYRVLAELLRREGDHAGARDAFLQAADAGHAHLRGEAIGEAARAEGPDAGITLYRRLELANQANDHARMAVAPLYGKVGKIHECLAALDSVRTDTRSKEKSVAALRPSCRATE